MIKRGNVYALISMTLMLMIGFLRLQPSTLSLENDDGSTKIYKSRAYYDEDENEDVELRFCHNKELVFPSAGGTGEATATIQIAYQCAGDAYENFTNQLEPYARQYAMKHSAEGYRRWGKRDFPFPANTTILGFGNSHTRQVFYTLLCQYAEQVKSVERLGPLDVPYFSVFIEVIFSNNASFLFLGNHPFVHSHQWSDLLRMHDPRNRTLDQFDAVVLGDFNKGRPDQKHAFTPEILAFQERHPDLPIDLEHIQGPKMNDLVGIYNKTIVALPGFSVNIRKWQAGDRRHIIRGWEKAANRIMEQLRTPETNSNTTSDNNSHQNSRTNIYVLHTRGHIEALGAECGAINKAPFSTCYTQEEGASMMHRCTGPKGGDADLVASDLVEAVYEYL